MGSKKEDKNFEDLDALKEKLRKDLIAELNSNNKIDTNNGAGAGEEGASEKGGNKKSVIKNIDEKDIEKGDNKKAVEGEQKKEKNKREPKNDEEKKVIKEAHDSLYNVIDPELNIDIVNLGLVYDVYFTTDDWLKIDVTLTTPLCPLTDEIEKQIANALEGVVLKFEINWVWEPAWNMNMISDLGKEILSSMGYNFS